MTPEELAERCVRVPRRADGGTDWTHADPEPVPHDLKRRIAEAVHEAVAAEREACVRVLEDAADRAARAGAEGRPDTEDADLIEAALRRMAARLRGRAG